MAGPAIIFDDGVLYERAMGAWSRLAGEVFLDWLAPAPGLRWIDVGCGNGAFTEALMERCAPAEVQAIDPSEGQLAYARTRPGARGAVFQRGDAMALPFEADRFDAAAMALVIFFVAEPEKGVAEMARVVGPGGLVAAYAWDMPGGGFPFHPAHQELRALGIAPPLPPRAEVSRTEGLRALWEGAGLEAVETRAITVQRHFESFDDYWESARSGSSLRAVLEAMAQEQVARIEAGVRARMPADRAGRITHTARANAVRGRVPA
ncbi:MAG TPA: methyltransferase domain-containing protein [Acetobacteraceae bacterium]|nr:methyltransferase domain-containing protein [Acetobacteraceae bacterium]